MPAAPETHPTAEEWDDQWNAISAIYRLTETRFNRLEEQIPNATLFRMEKDLKTLKRQVEEIQSMLERAGREKEQHFSLPSISLPEWEVCFIVLMPLLGLALTWFVLGGGWSSLLSLFL